MTLGTNHILFRASLAEERELEAARNYFPVITQRSEILTAGPTTVIGRYSVLPFYQELEADVKAMGGTLINSYSQHRYVADLQNWYEDLKDFTPETWFRLEEIPTSCEHGFILKGETNSKKFLWNTHMFAKDKMAAGTVYSRLCQDGMIGDQSIYIRKYVPLNLYGEGLNGLPIGEEYRFFILDGNIVGSSFYWASHVDDIPSGVPSPSVVPGDFLQKVITRIGDRTRFYVLDVACTQSGDWIVIELNDGQMSGLSLIDPRVLYANMKHVLSRKNIL